MLEYSTETSAENIISNNKALVQSQIIEIKSNSQ